MSDETIDPKDVTCIVAGHAIPITTEQRAAIIKASPHEAMRMERDRLAERLASAIERNKSLIEQRDEAWAAWNLCRVEAAYGRALLRMVGQLRRLRRAVGAGRIPFNMSREDQADAAREEIEESLLELPGSDAEAHEIIDAVGAVLQMFIGAGHSDAALLVKMTAGGERLAERLDMVDAGLSWAQAKLAQRCEHPDMPVALHGLLNAAGKCERRDAVNAVMDLCREWQERDR